MTRQQDERCLLIVGASTRAAAFSALRAKWQPVCIAKFLDEDLKAVARVLTWPRTLRQVVTLAKSLPECPWLYTGAVENHPALIDAISQSRPLWGNPGDVVRAVRDPFRVARVLQDHDIPALELRPAHDPPRPDGTWLVKPLQGAGGCGIAAWQGSRCDQRVARTAFFQRRVDGASLSAVFVANGAEAKRAGVTWQLIGVPSSQSAPFAYCGSIGPVVGAGPDDTDTNGQGGDARSTLRRRTACPATIEPDAMLPREAFRQIERIGSILASTFRLRGLFGCDLMWDGRTVWLTEVNPRYTASVEVLEYAYGKALLGSNETVSEPVQPRRFVGKQVLYAPRRLRVPPLQVLQTNAQSDAVPLVADLPEPASVVRAGEPICTVFADGPTLQTCWARLQDHVEWVRGELGAAARVAPIS